MSNGITLQDLFNALAPPKAINLTSAAIGIDSQGQFNAVNDATAIVRDAGAASHKVRINCILANARGKVDAGSLLEIGINSKTEAIDTLDVTTGTDCGHSLTLLTSTRGVILVKPNASGEVLVDIGLHGAENNVVVSLKHRHYSQVATLNIA